MAKEKTINALINMLTCLYSFEQSQVGGRPTWVRFYMFNVLFFLYVF